VPLIRRLREEHPAMSAKVMYRMIAPQTMGRDKFIAFCMSRGFKVSVKRNCARTTDSRGVIRFSNKIKGLKITGVNQVWVSDITYYRIGSRFYYITFIMDAKSRFIVGYNVSGDLRTINTTVPALIMALRRYPGVKGLIFHSDGGGQYYCKEFVALTTDNGIINSMTEDNGENNHAERINGTIKNQYLSCYMPTSFMQLQKQTDKAVYNYNFKRPHQSLKMQTPSDNYTVINNIASC
jgi:putative transposase